MGLFKLGSNFVRRRGRDGQANMADHGSEHVLRAEVRGALAAGLRYAADLILPPMCLCCHDPVDSHNTLCPRCWRSVRFIRPPVCDRLGVPLPFDTGDQSISSQALAYPPAYDRARAVAAFDGAMRELIHSFKYGDRHEGLPLFTRWLVSTGRELLAGADMLVPVPLHPFRLWRRRFNQSAVLARWLSRETGVPVCLALKRVRYTAQQVGLSLEERRENVAGAFRVPGGVSAALVGSHVVLIDDVITTGATVESCARALKEAGAARVDVLALARVTDSESPLV